MPSAKATGRRDEKIFTKKHAHNQQNDGIWSAVAPGTSAIIECRQWVKINQEVYRRDILEAVVLPWAQQHFADTEWLFQQDSAPAHRAKLTQDWCKANFPDFITSSEWLPYSPDLNPMDYSVWSILESRACAKCHISLEALKKSKNGIDCRKKTRGPLS
ncbi:uncharacterized protein [Drosophila kikkawai]|uniref:Tc1-like transposase DDE domain-containing protein n=1 Tax=Drosophila kikkawai TaxID=30033 RepID=A0ABM4GFZ3_DROKI